MHTNYDSMFGNQLICDGSCPNCSIVRIDLLVRKETSVIDRPDLRNSTIRPILLKTGNYTTLSKFIN